MQNNITILKLSNCGWGFILVLFLFVADGLALNPHTAVDKYIHRHWAVRDGLPHRTVTCFAQDLSGFIWIGTDNGLARFDGNDFQVFNDSTSEEIKNNSISALFISLEGTLWIGTNGGGITIYKNNRFLHYSTRDGLPSNFICSITGVSDQNVWVSTCGGGVARFSYQQLNIFKKFQHHDPSGWGHCVPIVFCFSRENTWLGTDKGLYFFKGKQSGSYTVRHGLVDDRIRAICKDRNGDLWIGTVKGVSKIKLSQGKLVAITNPERFLDHYVYTLLSDRNGLLWVASQQGLFRVSGNKSDRIERVSIFEAVTGKTPVVSLFEDRDGALWFGNEGGGMNCFRDEPFSSITTGDGLSHPYVTSIYQDNQETVWIGTKGGGLNRLINDRFKVYTRKDGLSSNYITAIGSDRAGNLWVGTPDGLNQWDGNRFTTFTVRDGLASSSISALYKDHEGNSWIGTASGLNGYKNSRFYTPGEPKQLENATILAMAADVFGNLWIGTNKGFYCLKTRRTPPVLKRISRRYIITEIFIDSSSSIWLGTNGSGMMCFDDTYNTIIPYPKASDFSNARVYKIFEDKQRNLWMSSNNGVFVISQRFFNKYNAIYGGALSPNARYYHFLESDGLPTAVFSGGTQPAGWKTTDGNLWFPTINGITIINPGEVKLQDPELPVIIEKVKANHQAFLPKERTFFPKKTREIEFFFTALNFNGLENLKFKCRLDSLIRGRFGSSEKIVTQKHVVFQDIPPSKYIFTVRAGNPDKGWSKEVSYHFTIDYGIVGFDLFIVILIFLLPISVVIFSKILERRAKEKEVLRIFTDDARYKTHVVEQKELKKYTMQLLNVMEEEKPYLDPNMTVTKLAKRLGISKENISQIINQRFYMNFNQFLNKYRIEEAKKSLKDPKEINFVVLKIAHDVGFNSKSTFNTAFKKFTGLSPSQYREKYLEETGSKS